MFEEIDALLLPPYYGKTTFLLSNFECNPPSVVHVHSSNVNESSLGLLKPSLMVIEIKPSQRDH